MHDCADAIAHLPVFEIMIENLKLEFKRRFEQVAYFSIQLFEWLKVALSSSRSQKLIIEY